VPSVNVQVEPVIVADQHRGSLGIITIDNPERRNAMTAAMYAAVPAACQELEAIADLRAVIVRGAGQQAFCAGSDISEFRTRRLGDHAATYDQTEHLAWAALAELPVPVVAMVYGPCRGGGIALALHADLRIAADSANFSVPPANLGIAYPAEATRRLTALVGPGTAKRLLFTAEVLSADQALRHGLIDEVVAEADLEQHVRNLTYLMATKAPLTLRAAKAGIDALSAQATGDPQAGTLQQRAEAAANACYDSADFREGIDAFSDKRPPQFRGR